MTALPHAGERRCVGCGCILRAGHEGERCECCERARLQYNPAHDPELPSALLDLLRAHRGRPVHLCRELGITYSGRTGWNRVQSQIRRLRRHGHVIAGAHDGTYVYLYGAPEKS